MPATSMSAITSISVGSGTPVGPARSMNFPGCTSKDGGLAGVGFMSMKWPKPTYLESSIEAASMLVILSTTSPPAPTATYGHAAQAGGKKLQPSKHAQFTAT